MRSSWLKEFEPDLKKKKKKKKKKGGGGEGAATRFAPPFCVLPFEIFESSELFPTDPLIRDSIASAWGYFGRTLERLTANLT